MKSLKQYITENFLYLHYSDTTFNSGSLTLITEKNAERTIERHSKDGYIILSACRGGEDFGLPDSVQEMTIQQFNKFKEENNKRSKELLSEVKARGFSYTPVYGGFKETTSSGDKVDVYEHSVIVYARDKKGNLVDIEELVKWGLEMCNKYNQDSILVKRPNEDPKYIKGNGKVDMEFTDKVKFNDFAQDYFTALYKNMNGSKMKSSKPVQVTFEAFMDPAPGCYSERHIRALQGEIF